MASPFSDEYTHMEYRFCQCLIRKIAKDGKHERGIDISDKVTFSDFQVNKSGEHVNPKSRKSDLVTSPEVSVARGIGTGLTRDIMESLPKIIADWNARYGTNFDKDVAASSLVSLRSTLRSNERIKRSAKANSKHDFVSTIDDQTEGALVENYDKHQDFYNFLLDHTEVRKDLIHLLVNDLYNGLCKSDE
jgi:type I restriction enzyme R subunit